MTKSLKKPNPEVTEFANALKMWAEEGPKREQKERVDAAAAVLILQSWLDLPPDQRVKTQ